MSIDKETSGNQNRLPELEHVIRYAPILFFDAKEPFYPVRVGVTILRNGDASPSFKRKFIFADETIDHVIEYAIYWDYDIQHLYELEHVWVYVDSEGEVADCEASFHGRYLKGLLPDRSNLQGTRVKLYSQPGKHAFSPLALLFELLPGVRTCTDEEAGADGLTVPDWFGSRTAASEEDNRMVRDYLYSFHRFTPSFEYIEYEFAGPADLFVTWKQLFEEIPERIERELQAIKSTLKKRS